jgi:hypothetical protein
MGFQRRSIRLRRQGRAVDLYGHCVRPYPDGCLNGQRQFATELRVYGDRDALWK